MESIPSTGRPDGARLAEICGVLAPVSFVGGWAICGALRSGYDPVHEAISQLAREDTPGRLGMTAGFLGFGFLLPVFAGRLPDLLGATGSLRTALRVTVTVAGAATLAVAAFPLQRIEGGAGDLLHELSAGVGYLAMVAAPALGTTALRRGGRTGASAVVASAVCAGSAACLGLSLTTGSTGLWQRAGLGVVDVWFAGWALSALSAARRGGSR